MSDSIEITKMLLSAISGRVNRDAALKMDVSKRLRETVTETEIYWGRLVRKEQRDFNIEADLARRWSATAAQAALYDETLSTFCLDISQYWANPPTDPSESFGKILDTLYTMHRQLLDDGILHSY